MTESDNDLEQLLRGLPRRQPSAQLDARILASVRGGPARVPVQRYRVWWMAVAASVAIMIGVEIVRERSLQMKPQPQKSVVATTVNAPTASFESPMELETTVSRTIDDGIVDVEDGVPYRQIRRETVKDYWIVDPSTGAKARVRVPSEQVLVCREETF
jgi:hypothetical protein